jgi:transposase
MDEITRIGMDTSKQVFQLHGVDALERTVLRRKLRRREVLSFFEGLAPCTVGLEACGGSHYWARELSKRGHAVRLLAPQHAKPYVKRGKNDAADAAALCEAMSRPGMQFVPMKSEAEQAALMLFGLRERLLRRRTQLSNAIRGHAAEFGLVAAKGLCRIEPLLERIAASQGLPALARALFAEQGVEYAELEERLRRVEAELLAWHRSNETSRRLAEIPGVGPTGAVALVMKTPDPGAFRSGRQFAAWLGMTPKDHSTAGRQRLGAITRAGDETLRSLLIVGAMSLVRQAQRRPERASPWLLSLLARKPAKLAAVALANKNARTAWVLMARGGRYRKAGSVPAMH